MERTDRLSTEQRSYLMPRVKPKDSKIELVLRSALWRAGLRFRKHVTSLPGTPDIVFPKARIAVFVDSEFWHGYNWERRKLDFRSRQDFWLRKIEENIARDRRVDAELKNRGWRVVRFWGRQIEQDLVCCVDKLERMLKNRR